MEIKELVPKSKELIVQPKTQEGVFFDVFSYALSTSGGSPEGRQNLSGNGKSYLYIISQVQSGDSSLDYVPNLIASFMKREFESGSDEFENSLKKTNELIDGLLKKNDIKLDLGVALINKERISVSKIGKAKMLVHRPRQDETFDVFENVTEFSKSHINNKRFSNIISGEIKKDDRFFFFISNNRLNPKQKLIISSLSKNDQEDFLNEMNKIIHPVPCCGIYFEMKEELKKIIRELPKESSADGAKEKKIQITATEVAKINKGDTLKRTAEKFKEMVIGENSDNKNWRLTRPRGMNNYFIVTVIALVFVAALFFLTKGDSKLKEGAAAINEKLRASESRFLLKENYEARKFLDEAFKGLDLLEEGKQKDETFLAAMGLLNRIEKVNIEAKPGILIDLANYQNLDSNKLTNILAQGDRVFVNDLEGIYTLNESEAKPVEGPGNIILSWMKDHKIIVLAGNIKIIDLESNKIGEIRKKFGFEPVEMKNYEDNLYFLGSKNIYKITNALISPREELEWLKPAEVEKVPGNFTAFDFDSNIYVLTSERKMAVLFKGELAKLIDLDFEIRPGTELFNLGNNELLMVDKEMKLARLIDNSGGLKMSYDLSDVDEIKDAFFNKESRILYLLSPTKIWSLKI